MTNNRNYYTSSNYATINSVPTREEFHRYASNVISIGDFDTDHSNGYQVNKVDSALRWTIKNSNQTKNNKNKKGTK